MLIKTEASCLLNLDHIVLISKEAMYAPGSNCTKDDVLHYRVAGIPASGNLPKIEIADNLTFTEAQALLSELFRYVTDDLNLQDVSYLLGCIRRGVDPESDDDEINLTEQGRALLREECEGAETRQLDDNGEAL